MSGSSAVQKQSLADVLQYRRQASNSIKKRLQHKRFPMKFMKSLRTPCTELKLFSRRKTPVPESLF